MFVRITSKRAGFHRCGIAHAAVPTDHPADRFTEQQLARLQAEPMLTFELLDGELPGEADEPGQEAPKAKPTAKPASAKPGAKPAAKGKG